MAKSKKRDRPQRPTALAPSYSSPIAVLALGMLGGYAAMVLLPATGSTQAPLWHIALGATVVTLVATALAVRNCVPLGTTPLRGRLVAALCVLGWLASGVFTRQMYVFETEPSRNAPMAESPDQQPERMPPLGRLFGRSSSRRSAN